MSLTFEARASPRARGTKCRPLRPCRPLSPVSAALFLRCILRWVKRKLKDFRDIPILPTCPICLDVIEGSWEVFERAPEALKTNSRLRVIAAEIDKIVERLPPGQLVLARQNMKAAREAAAQRHGMHRGVQRRGHPRRIARRFLELFTDMILSWEFWYDVTVIGLVVFIAWLIFLCVRLCLLPWG